MNTGINTPAIPYYMPCPYRVTAAVHVNYSGPVSAIVDVTAIDKNEAADRAFTLLGELFGFGVKEIRIASVVRQDEVSS